MPSHTSILVCSMLMQGGKAEMKYCHQTSYGNTDSLCSLAQERAKKFVFSKRNLWLPVNGLCRFQEELIFSLQITNYTQNEKGGEGGP